MTLIDGIPVLSEKAGSASAPSSTIAARPWGRGRRQRRSAQAAERGEWCSPEWTHGSANLSSRGPSFASTAGRSVSAAASTKTTDSMMPRLVDRNAGLGTGPSRRQRSDGERSRAAILREAARLATVEGLDGLSLARLAAAVGMSKSGLFAHFGSKEELQLATIDAASAIFDELVIAPAGDEAAGVP